jgi:hypothetical protein
LATSTIRHGLDHGIEYVDVARCCWSRECGLQPRSDHLDHDKEIDDDMTVTKPLEEQIAKVHAELEQAEQEEHRADLAHVDVAGKLVLEEASTGELKAAAMAYRHAQQHTSALRSALALLGQRQQAAEAAQAAKRVQALREQSDSAHKAEQAALARAASLAKDLQSAMADADAEAVIVAKVNADLRAADADKAEAVDSDYRAELQRISNTSTSRRMELREAVASARYMLQRSDGSDPPLIAPVVLLGQQIAGEGLAHSVAMPLVLDFELKVLAEIEANERSAQEQALAQHGIRSQAGGLGHLPTRPAVALDPAVVGRLLPDTAKRALSSLFEYVPTSAWQGQSVREIRPKDAVSARQKERALEAGRAALKALTG